MQSRLHRNRIYKLIDLFGDKLVNFYETKGPIELRKSLNIKDDAVWEIVIDYIGIFHDSMKNFVRNNSQSFKSLIYSGNIGQIRSFLSLDKAKYNFLWEELLDLLLEEVSIENFDRSTCEQSLRMFLSVYNSGRKQRKIITRNRWKKLD